MSGQIQYVEQMIDTKKKDYKKSISYNNLTELPKTFYEILLKPEYVHLYFDIDDVKSEDDYNEFINWLNSLKHVFGDYVIGGYTNNYEMFGELYKYLPSAKKTLSLHVIYYQTKIKANVLVELMRHTQKGFVYNNINPLCDPNVYKLLTRQLMRHVYSDKFYGRNRTENAITHGSFLGDVELKNTFIQIRGDEEEVDYDKLKELFGYGIEEEVEDDTYSDYYDIFSDDDTYSDYDIEQKPTEQKQKPTEQNRKPKKKSTIKIIDHEDELIMFSKSEMLEFLDHFEPSFDTVMNKLRPLFSSPYSKDFLNECVHGWYNKEKHSSPNAAIEFIDRYYEHEESNKWFFSLIKKLEENDRKHYLNKYGFNKS